MYQNFSIASEGEMVVTWVTQAATGNSTVEYGIGNLAMTQTGSTDKFTDGGLQHRVLYMHRVVLQHLKPATRYCK